MALLALGLPQVVLAETASNLLSAFEVTGATASSYTGEGVASSVMTSFGGISPHEGANFAVISTGNATTTDDGGWSTDFGVPGPDGDMATLSVTLTVPAGKNSILFDFYFISQEYPTWVNQGYNDAFTAVVSGSSKVANGTNVAKDQNGQVIDVNSATFLITGGHADLAGTTFATNGGTGWVTAGVPVGPGDSITLAFAVADAGDGVVTSTTLLDNFRFESGSVDAGVQSALMFDPTSLSMVSCGASTINLSSSRVASQQLTVALASSNTSVVTVSPAQTTISQYKSAVNNTITLTAHANGTANITASTNGFSTGTLQVTVSGCPEAAAVTTATAATATTLPETGANASGFINRLIGDPAKRRSS